MWCWGLRGPRIHRVNATPFLTIVQADGDRQTAAEVSKATKLVEQLESVREELAAAQQHANSAHAAAQAKDAELDEAAAAVATAKAQADVLQEKLERATTEHQAALRQLQEAKEAAVASVEAASSDAVSTLTDEVDKLRKQLEAKVKESERLADQLSNIVSENAQLKAARRQSPAFGNGPLQLSARPIGAGSTTAAVAAFASVSAPEPAARQPHGAAHGPPAYFAPSHPPSPSSASRPPSSAAPVPREREDASSENVLTRLLGNSSDNNGPQSSEDIEAMVLAALGGPAPAGRPSPSSASAAASVPAPALPAASASMRSVANGAPVAAFGRQQPFATAPGQSAPLTAPVAMHMMGSMAPPAPQQLMGMDASAPRAAPRPPHSAGTPPVSTFDFLTGTAARPLSPERTMVEQYNVRRCCVLPVVCSPSL